MKKIYLIFAFLLIVLRIFAQVPEGYYDSAEGKTGENLQQALYLVIKDHTSLSYSDLWDAFYYTDRKSNGKVWDMYSDIPGGTPAYQYDFFDDQCGNYSGEGSCYNREHSFPKSWFDDGYPMYTDLFHLYPTDGFVNGKRSNFPFGEVSNPEFTSTNGSKQGPCSYPGYSGDAFEPIDEYKGDFARSYFYMATRYYNVIDDWNSAMLDGTQHPAFTQWALNMLMEWHSNDPISQKEIDRNNVIYNNYQHNRNPYIDHPEYVDLVWGTGTVEYTITASTGANGSISPSGTITVVQGQTKTFTITPNSGYHIESLIVDGLNVGTNPSYTFTNVTADHTIHAIFAINTYTITATAGLNGSISPSGNISVNHGQSQTFTISPNEGYHISDVLVNGSSVGAVTSYTFSNISSNQSITASFTINSYTITASAGPNGNISPSGSISVNFGESKSFTITPNEGCFVTDVLVNGNSVGAVSSYTFTNINSNQSITASFGVTTFTITANAGSNGNISPSGLITVNYGNDATFTVESNVNYHIDDVLVNGISVGAVSSYTFQNVTSNQSISASFAVNTYIITSSSSEFGEIEPIGEVVVNHGANQTFAISPDINSYITSVLVDDENVGLVSSYTFTNITKNHTIHAEFSNVSPITHTIIATAGDNGYITPSGIIEVAENDNKTFTISPNQNYHISDVKVDGVSIGAVSTFTFVDIESDHTIHAEFEINVYTITSFANENGSISPLGETEVIHGENLTYTIVPDEGYHIDRVLVDNVDVGTPLTYLFEDVSESHSIEAFFSINTYMIISSTDGNGTISPTGEVIVNHGDDQIFTITPNEGFDISDVTIDGESIGAVASYTFESVTLNHSISVAFTLKSFTIQASSGENGYISPSGEVVVDYGDSKLFTITPDENYTISEVLVDGESIGIISEYTFEVVKENHTIEVEFSLQTFTITAIAHENGSIYPGGEIVVNSGENQSFTILPNTGYTIHDVLVDGLSLGNIETYTFNNIYTNHSIEAFFEISQYTLTVGVSGNGKVKVDGEDYSDPLIFNHGTAVTMSAIPEEYWQFESWTGDISGRDTPITISMNGNKTVTANFIEIPNLKFTLTINITGNGEVTVNSETYTSPIVVDKGTILSINALADEGWAFSNWSGDLTGRDTPQNITMNSNKTVNTLFSELTNINPNANAQVMLFPNPFGLQLQLSNAMNVKEISLSNVIGQNVLQIRNNGSQQITIDTQSIPKGIYIVSLRLKNDKMIFRKVIKE